MADRRPEDNPLAPRRTLGTRAAGTQTDAGTTRGTADQGPRRTTGDQPSRGDRGSATDLPRRQPSQGTHTAQSSTRQSGPARPRTRKARLRLTHLDPWSVMKTSFLLSVAFGIVTVIAVSVVWSVLGAAGVWDSINQTVQEVIGGESGDAFDVENYIGASRVMGFTMIVAVVDVVLITAIATLGAFLYNLAAALLGGLEVTLAEDEH